MEVKEIMKQLDKNCIFTNNDLVELFNFWLDNSTLENMTIISAFINGMRGKIISHERLNQCFTVEKINEGSTVSIFENKELKNFIPFQNNQFEVEENVSGILLEWDNKTKEHKLLIRDIRKDLAIMNFCDNDSKKRQLKKIFSSSEEKKKKYRYSTINDLLTEFRNLIEKFNEDEFNKRLSRTLRQRIDDVCRNDRGVI